MAYSNDGGSFQNEFYPRMSGQDRKYFPYNPKQTKETSIEEKWHKKNKKLEEGLTKMLGSKARAVAYMRAQGYIGWNWW